MKLKEKHMNYVSNLSSQHQRARAVVAGTTGGTEREGQEIQKLPCVFGIDHITGTGPRIKPQHPATLGRPWRQPHTEQGNGSSLQVMYDMCCNVV